MRTSNFIIIFLFSFLFSCKKETFVGPPIETYFGNLTISESFSHNKPVGVDFSNGDTLNFSAEFSIQAEFNINIVGRTSGANFNINQTSQNLENTFWLGESNTIFFKQYEWCDITLSFNGHDTILTDSVLILGVQDFSQMGKLLTSFEDPSEYNVVNGSSTVTNNIISNVNLSVHGTNFLEIKGEGQGTYFGATRFQFNNGTIAESEASNIYFNGFFNSSYSGSAVVVKFFEDHNNNNQYDAGVDEAWSFKQSLSDDNLWHKLSFNLNDFNVDISGNNVLVDGVINTNNIIRIDVICSQQGTAFGEYGFFADYYLLSYNEPL